MGDTVLAGLKHWCPLRVPGASRGARRQNRSKTVSKTGRLHQNCYRTKQNRRTASRVTGYRRCLTGLLRICGTLPTKLPVRPPNIGPLPPVRTARRHTSALNFNTWNRTKCCIKRSGKYLEAVKRPGIVTGSADDRTETKKNTTKEKSCQGRYTSLLKVYVHNSILLSDHAPCHQFRV